MEESAGGPGPYLGIFDSRQSAGEASEGPRLLIELNPPPAARVLLSVALLPDTPGDGAPLAVPGLQRCEVPLLPLPSEDEASPARVEASAPGLSPGRHGDEASPAWAESPAPGRYVVAFPCSSVREGLARLGPAGAEAFSLARLFHRRFRVTLELCAGDTVLAADGAEVELYDLGRFGTLYQRLMDRLLRPDTAAQALRRGRRRLPPSHHPWYPVLTIGMDKARRYLEAIESDLRGHTEHLPDPRWLLRVGLYLELLTCLGIDEAVRPEHPGLLSPEERHALETAPLLAPIRERLDGKGWRAVWGLRRIAPSARRFRTTLVATSNLLRKQRATLAFLETHHEDLARALELAGPARGGTREAWQRVFQDAERAVLRNARRAFPELRRLPPGWRQFMLWHERGNFEALGLGRVPGWLSWCMGDRDGLFASASRQYRRSMNAVACQARARGWMEYPGGECIPPEASFIESLLTALGPLREGREAMPSASPEGPRRERSREQLLGCLLFGTTWGEPVGSLGG